ncbi:Bor/Iss family lipoprotein [Dysgonomonas macrotermitis]|nr:Bor family protein [Dysgonomonas macrotermitis]
MTGFLVIAIVSLLLMTSCYTSRVNVGNATAETSRIKVSETKNKFLFWGLLPLDNEQNAKAYVGDKKDYITETSWSVSDGLLNYITLGIYSPTTTTYYVPYEE